MRLRWIGMSFTIDDVMDDVMDDDGYGCGYGYAI